MANPALDPRSRASAIGGLQNETLDVLVIGGGVTGAGIALDAAARGLKTGLVEAQDWASGTSSRSTKLAHGGLRYLLMLDFKLVHEALTERDLMLSTTAPHLVRPVPFLYPLSHPFLERPYVATGVGLYDLLAHTPGRKRALPIQQHLSGRQLTQAFPDLKAGSGIGAVRYYDAQVDDARLVLTLVRTAVQYGAYATSRVQVIGLTKSGHGRVTGARATDLTTGQTFQIKAKQVIAATGVWTEQTEAMAGTGGGLQVLASKGVHIVVPRERINGTMGVISMTEKSVLFLIPHDTYWLIGTTDTPWTQDFTHPVATQADIDYLLEHANAILNTELTRQDIIGTYAGLRPLLQPGTKAGTSSAKVSREHTVASPAPGLTVIAGGKLTTYRVMAQDAVDFALGPEMTQQRPSVTANLPLLGAAGYQAVANQAAAIGARYGWTPAQVDHLLGRYGTLIGDITDLVDRDESLGQPVEHAGHYLKAEIVYAATHEDVIHLEDVMVRRTRLNHEAPGGGLAASRGIADLLAPHLGWDEAQVQQEVVAYARQVEADQAAAQVATDAAAEAIRQPARGLTPMLRGAEPVPAA